jgi:asparagine synthase (glutamine-hydrolysing)
LPGHFLIWRDGDLRIEKYWDVSFEPKHAERKDADFVEEWRELFQKSVELRLMSDVSAWNVLVGRH